MQAETNILQLRREDTMNSPDKSLRTGLVLFIVAAVFTFGFITLLQFLEIPVFFVALVLMHVGIFTFIASKRVFKKAGYDVRNYYKTQYVLLIPYVVVMVYTFACRFGLLPMFEDAKTIFTLCYTGLCVLITIWNLLRMKRDLERQRYEQ